MRKPSLAIIFLTVFIDLIGFGIVLPLLPRYSERYGASGFTIGAIIASFSAMQFLLSPWWGRLSDRIGRRPVLLISNGGSVVAYALFALAALPGLTASTAIAVLLASRVFAGACGANLSVASAYIADITPPEKRSKSMALIGVAFGLGFILGPAIGAVSARWLGLAGPGSVAAGLCAANFVLACVVLAESRQPSSSPRAPRPALAQWLRTLRHRDLGLLVGLYFLSTFCFASFESTIPLLLGSPSFHPDDFRNPQALATRLLESEDAVARGLRERLSPETRTRLRASAGAPGTQRGLLFREFNELLTASDLFNRETRRQVVLRAETRELAGHTPSPDSRRRLNRLLLEDAFPDVLRRQPFYYDEQRIGYLFAYCGIVSALIQGGIIGRLVRRFGEGRVIFISLLGIAVSLGLMPYAENLAGLLLVLGIFSAGSGLNRAPTMGLISIQAPEDEQGATLGIAQSAGTLARIIGPVFATTLYAVRPHSPYLATASIALLAAGLAWVYLCRRP